jgi:hypothetical protein
VAAPRATQAGGNTRKGKRMGPNITIFCALLIEKDLLLSASKIYNPIADMP